MSLDTAIRDKLLADAYARGRADALDLRGRAADMDGTSIIAEKRKIPQWDNGKDYSDAERWPIGSPVVYGGRTYGLLIHHNAAHYPGTTPDMWSAGWAPKHTKDPAKAEPYLAPNGTSGLWMAGDCCTDPDAENPVAVYRSKVDNGAYPPSEYPDNWELVEMAAL